MIQATDKDLFIKNIEQLFDMVPLFMLMREIVEDEHLNRAEMPKERADNILKTFKAVALRQTGSFLLQIGQLINVLEDGLTDPLVSMLVSNDCRYLLLAMEPLEVLAEQLQAYENADDGAKELSAKIASARELIADKVEELKTNCSSMRP